MGSVLVASTASTVWAQQPDPAATARVVDLNRQAMQAYTNLEMERAMDLLNQAVQICRSSNLTGAPLARTHLNRGVVSVGGLADNAAGIEAFTEALRADPNVRLDPITSTPDIEAAFTLAKQQAQAGAPTPPGPGGTAAPGGPAGPPTGPPPPGGPPSGAMILHIPPPEQLEMTPVPIYLEVAPFVRVGAIFVWYRGLGMPEYQRVQAQPISNGYGVQIDCMAVFQPQLVYYIGIADPQGNFITYAGSPEAPIVVPVVATRTQEPAHLPDMPPPDTCVAGDQAECPPGMEESDPRCRRASRCGDGQCTGNEDFTCPQDCIPGEMPEETGPTLPQVFAAVGFGMGGGFARSELMTNPEQDVTCTKDIEGEPEGEEACLDVSGGFAIIPPAFRLAGGFFITDEMSLGASFRYQIIGEDRASVADAFVNYHIEVRFAYWFRRSLEKRLWIYAFAATGYGAMQPQIDVSTRSGDESVTVYQNAGLNNASAGAGALWHFGDPGGFAILGELDIDQFFPTMLTAFELWVGAEHGF